MITNVACVIPTRGDVPLDPIVDALSGIEKTTAPVILTQDDDCILPRESIDALLAAYEPGHVVCNVPERFRHRYTDSGLVGFGAVFDRSLPEYAFGVFGNGTFEPRPGREIFRRTCDIIFTMLTPMIMVDVPYTNLDYASDNTRMWKQPNHFEEREQVRELCRRIIEGRAA